MRQHAIPQNILDVEFKLFTKFTLKEFAYLAIGLGFGGVMIYLTVRETIPAILGIPVFIISSGAGIFLGLVPVNDQDADVFIKNYVSAITNPTQRVWLNKEMKKDRIKPQIKPSEDGQLIPKDTPKKKAQIIGGELNVKTEEKEETIIEEQESIPKEVKTVVPIDPNVLLITAENISNYQFNISSIDNLPGNINIWLCTKDFKPIPNVVGYLKSEQGNILYANRTGTNGYFLTNKIWGPGIYIITFEHPAYKFPNIKMELSSTISKFPIKINSL